jgi:hypothetical protein
MQREYNPEGTHINEQKKKNKELRKEQNNNNKYLNKSRFLIMRRSCENTHI